MGMKESSIRNLMVRLKSYKNISKLEEEQLRNYFKLTGKEIEMLEKADSFPMDRYIDELREKDIKFFTYLGKSYPEALRHIAQPPPFLFYRGQLEALTDKTIAVVGTRKATSYGRNACEKIVDGLVAAGVTTVSGLALGIDTCCHRRTLEQDGRTIAVLGSGIDVKYPSENRKYWDMIVEKGLILSEFVPGTIPAPYNFPQRNRIIAGISRGVVIVESREKGGSLITATIALEEGRDVYAIPGEIFSPVSEGCNNLIRKSEAKLITSAEHILEEYGWRKSDEIGGELELTPKEREVFIHFNGSMSLDELILATGMNVTDLLSTLTELELKGIVSSEAGGRYRRKV
jgi:DNA processing protein